MPWDRVMHICLDNLTIIGSDNGLSPGRCQAIIRTNAGILLIGPLEQTWVKFISKSKDFNSRKYTLNVVYKLAAILSRSHYVKYQQSEAELHETYSHLFVFYWLRFQRLFALFTHIVQATLLALGQSDQNKIWNLPDRSTILPKFIYDKEGKLAGVRRYFDPHDILTPGSKYRNDILTPLTIFWLPYDNQWQRFIFLLYIFDKVCHYINIIY